MRQRAAGRLPCTERITRRWASHTLPNSRSFQLPSAYSTSSVPIAAPSTPSSPISSPPTPTAKKSSSSRKRKSSFPLPRLAPSAAAVGRFFSPPSRKSPTAGYVYRHHKDAPKRPARPATTVRPLPKLPPSWEPLPITLPQQVIKPPVEIPVGRLAHDLQRVVFNEGVHPLKDFETQKFMFDPFLAKIHQPSDINYDAMAQFITTSKDEILHKMAGENAAKYKGSTSSMGPPLIQCYRLLSGFKRPDLSFLSSRFAFMSLGYTSSSIKPVSLFLRPKDGIYSIDSDPGDLPVRSNQILLDLGKSMERMLTTEPTEFHREFLLSGDPTGKYNAPEAYHYLKMGDFLLRSQLDCHEPGLEGDRKTFDLKTRATNAIRLNMQQYQEHLSYTLSRLQGVTRSYEREFYDLCRAGLLKYWYQVRIGQMHGIFLCYHNTAEIFGFEYLKQQEMERILFGNSELADVAFQGSMQLWQRVLNKITETATPNKTLRVVMWADDITGVMDVFVEPVESDSGWLEPNRNTAPGDFGLVGRRTSPQDYMNQMLQQSRSSTGGNSEEEDVARYERLKTSGLRPIVRWFQIRLTSYVNGQKRSETGRSQLVHRPGDRLDVFYQCDEVTPTSRTGIANMLVRYTRFLENSMLYAKEDDDDEDEDSDQ